MAGGELFKINYKTGSEKRASITLIENTKFMLFKNNISEIATKHHGNWYEPNEWRKESETDALETLFCCLFQYCEK